MRHSLFLLGLFAGGWLPLRAADLPNARQQVIAARAILDPWQRDHAEAVERRLHIVCWTPMDREFPADHKSRLSRMLQRIQGFYAQEMDRHGFGPRSINLQLDADRHVVIHEVRGQHPTTHYKKSSGSEIRKECLPLLQQAGINADKETMAIFCNLATWDPERLKFTHESPYYAGGDFLHGTAWQLDSPELDATNLSLTTPQIQDGEYGRISLGKHNSIFIGGMAHELGHALGLPHCKARPDEAIRGAALMGSGNRSYGEELRSEGPGTFLTLAHALRLASHPQFSGRLESKSVKPTATMINLDLKAEGKGIVVSGVVKGEPPLYGVVAYFDPDGGSDYDATTATAIPDDQGRFLLQTEALTKGIPGELRLRLLHANGAVTDEQSLPALRMSYSVGESGVPDLTTIQTRLALEPVIKALAEGHRDLAQRAAQGIKLTEASAIAAKLISPEPRQDPPSSFRGSEMSMSLTYFAATSAKVGWRKPTFDQLPDTALLLESGGRIYATGIYAHAPATHAYSLGGKWNTLTGKVGIAAGHTGKARFEIHGDSQILWKSDVIGPGKVASFEVPVAGVDQLELQTFPPDDGPRDAWGLWLEPRLNRK